MSFTTRKGYRKTLVAKRYAAHWQRVDGKKIGLKEARKATAIVEVLIKILKPLTDKQRNKVVRCVKILSDME